MQVECLESRSLLSVAPPSASLIATVNYQPNSYENSAYLSRISAGLNYLPSGPASSLSPTGPDLNFSSPSQSSGGQIYIRPLTGSQAEPLLADGIGAGGIILNGMNNLGGLAQPQGTTNPFNGYFFNGASAYGNESQLVQGMLSSLRYVPSVPATGAQSNQPTITLSNGNSAPLSSEFAAPAVTGMGIVVSDSKGVSSPASPAILAAASNDLSAAANSGITAPDSSSVSSPASTGTTANASTNITAITAPASTSSSSPASTGVAAPASTTSDTSTTSNASVRLSPNSADGGMVTLLRQPIVAHSTLDAISIAAIDALLETPAKVDSVQGRFQAFEISVSSESPPPVVPPQASGAQSSLPFRPGDAQTSPVADPNLHSAWTPANLPGVAAMPNLFIAWIPSISTPAMATAENSPAEESAPLGDLPPEAVDKVFNSSPRLDLATAAVLAALVGRALWPTRSSVDDVEKGAKSEDRPRSARLRLNWLMPDC